MTRVTQQRPVPTTLDELIDGYSPFIDASIKKVTRGFVRDEDLDDVRQQIFLRIFTCGYLEKFDASRASFNTYLFTLIRSVVCNWIEYNSRRALNRAFSFDVARENAGDSSADGFSLDALACDDRFEERLLATLTLDSIQSGLAQSDAAVLGLLREQATAREISDELGISFNAVSHRVARVRHAVAAAV